MTIGKKEIMEFMPHRGDMLLLDEVREYTATTGVGIHHVKHDAFWCAGHFPDHPIMPGVLQVEALAQTAGFVVMKELVRTGGKKSIGYFASIDKIKFLQKVMPGDMLELRVEQISQKMRLHKFHGVAMVNGAKVCDAVFSAIISDQELP
jgi:3-hydroxyacyl-[acyl-carrier-protein] dehydratase